MPEAQLLNKVVPVRDRFQELKKYGVSLAIDNFGRGNSSFAALRYLPFAELKIDLSFVQSCASNKGNARICKSMIQFAQTSSARQRPSASRRSRMRRRSWGWDAISAKATSSASR